jgi:predicted RNA-binding protein with PUA-like domain
MKTEPDTFGIDDLERVNVEPWSGVRNYQARNTMRDHMRVGDRVLFYHSSVDPPGVAGLARIHRTGVVDLTQFDAASPYYDPTSTREAPRWICVDVVFERKLPALIPLGDLRGNRALDGMVLLARGSRLSVQPVTADQYRVVVAMAKPSRQKRT